MKGQSAPGNDGENPAAAADSAAGGPEWPACGDLDMRIARDGTWFYKGGPIGRKRLVKLFSTVLRREDDGTYWLVTPVERGRIEVEDAPFIAEEVQDEGDGRSRTLAFRTNVDDWVEADADHPLRIVHDPDTAEPNPYILVRNGLEARLTRSAFYHLVEMAETSRDDEGRERLGVWSKGSFFPLDAPEAPAAPS
jgi:hypothetical protein